MRCWFCRSTFYDASPSGPYEACDCGGSMTLKEARQLEDDDPDLYHAWRAHGRRIRLGITPPPWVPCLMGCGDFVCTIHDLHVYDCECPPLEDWTADPYAEPLTPPKSTS